MKVKIAEIFFKKFIKQIDFISNDKPGAAKKFKSDILNKLRELPSMPYKNRKSIFYDEDSIRDLIFKGYIIIYRIKEKEQEIEVFGFIKYIENHKMHREKRCIFYFTT